ncbi:MAG: hypothetical protein JXB04_03330, partial [Kiritimatiellae bacterium]|nr:hypothetical protein [Kiritimatiellia bacterium]
MSRMRTRVWSAAAALVAGLAGLAIHGADLYVWTNSPYPGLPFNAWTNAAWTIQEAVDAALEGDAVIVTDGFYNAGARVTPGYSLSNRVVITNAILVRSVNGPDATIIAGAPASGGGFGADAVRCVYMSAGALSGFTLTNGLTRQDGDYTNDCSGGGVLADGALVTNCLVTGNASFWRGGGVYGGMLQNCSVVGNLGRAGGGGACRAAILDSDIAHNVASNSGGGVYEGSLSNCVVSDNSAMGSPLNYDPIGGGAFHATLVDCDVRFNYAKAGGGAGEGTLENCLVVTNEAVYGGGVYGAAVSGCAIIGNTAYGEGGGSQYGTLSCCTLISNQASYGGGASHGYLTNCVLTGNRGNTVGGGAYYCTLVHCTVVDNLGYGAYESESFNSIIYFNGNSMYAGTSRYCCLPPIAWGEGDITNEPQFVDRAAGDFRLEEGCACVDAAEDLGLTRDLSGVPRPLDGDHDGSAVPDIGAHELASANSDTDNDHLSDLDEVLADTDALDPDSLLAVTSLLFGDEGVQIDWKGGQAVTQFIECREDL